MPLFPSDYPDLDRAYDLLRSDPEASLKICNDFLDKNPNHCLALQRKLFAYKRLKNWREALSVANNLISKNSEDCQIHNDAASLHYRLENYAETITHAHRALAVDADKWLGTVPYRLLAASHAQLGDLEVAHTYAEQAAAIDPKPFVPYGPLPSGTLSEFKEYLEQIAPKA